MSYCSLCKMDLGDVNYIQKYTHDIIEHQEYFEGQIINLSKEQIIDILVNITKSFYFDEN
ncbi:MAG: hypothetical protein ISR80_06220 [Nitrosopumilus sp.]|nr:hypothetical protein [Nitrosopumilus sp.]